MSYIDDDRDYIVPRPESHFIGYKCPHAICDLISIHHDMCLATRLRLNTMNPEYETESEFLTRLKWNFDQFMKKSPTALSVR